MSRYYEMYVKVTGHNLDKEDAIVEACTAEWDFDRDTFTQAVANGELPELIANGKDNLCGGESEEEFTDRLARAIWQANDGFCLVDVDATFLEQIPYESHRRDEDDYDRWKAERKSQVA